MAFTKIVSPGIDTTGSYIVQELNTVGIVTAGTVQVGAATTVHTTGIDLGSGNITSHNINSTGIISATSFVGPVTGNITGDITATSGTFSGNVSIGGTLTYEDVTNIDSVGIITAQAGVKVPDNQKVFLGTDSDLEIYHDGTASYIAADDLRITNNAVNETLAKFVNGGSVSLYHNDSKKFETTSAGLTIHEDTNKTISFTGGIGEIGNVTGFQALNTAGSALVDFGMRANTLRFATGSAERLRITSGGNVGINRVDPDQKLNVNGNIEVNAYDNASGSGGYYTAKGLIIGNLYDAGKSYTGSDDRTGCIWQERGLDLDFATNDSLRMKITSGGNVGINSTNPAYLLDIASGSASMRLNSTSTSTLVITSGTSNAARIEFGDLANNDTGYIYYDNSDDSMQFATNGSTERLRITSGGNVGVNDSAPSSLLSISQTNGNAKLQIKRANSASNTDDYGSILWRSAGGTAVGGINVARATGEDNGYMFFQTTSGGSMSEKMRIQPSGYIGIGEIAPGAKLTVKHANTATSGLNATLKLKQGVATNGNRSSLIFSSLDDYDVAAVNGVVDTHSGSAANNVGHLEFWTKESGNATALERMRVHPTGEVSINSTAYLGRFHIQQAAITEPPLSIRFHDASIYKNMGTVGPNDRNGNSASSGQYLHVRVRTVWNDSSMTMFRITGYFPYSDYTHSFVGMYRYGNSSYRTNPYGQVVHNLKRSTIHSIYNTAADPGYLVFVCDWNNNYTGLMIEHIGAGTIYGSYMQNDIEIIDSLRSTGTSALTF